MTWELQDGYEPRFDDFYKSLKYNLGDTFSQNDSSLVQIENYVYALLLSNVDYWVAQVRDELKCPQNAEYLIKWWADCLYVSYSENEDLEAIKEKTIRKWQTLSVRTDKITIKQKFQNTLGDLLTDISFDNWILLTVYDDGYDGYGDTIYKVDNAINEVDPHIPAWTKVNMTINEQGFFLDNPNLNKRVLR